MNNIYNNNSFANLFPSTSWQRFSPETLEVIPNRNMRWNYPTTFPAMRSITPSVDMQAGQFVTDHNSNMHLLAENKGGGKVKTKLISDAFHINSVVFFNERNHGDWDAVDIAYTVNGTAVNRLLTHKEFYGRNLADKFPGIHKDPTCPNKLFVELLSFLISICPNAQNVNYFTLQGWNKVNNVQLTFACNTGIQEKYFPFVPSSLRNRSFSGKPPIPFNEITKHLNSSLPFEEKLLLLISVSSILLMFYKNLGVEPEQILLVDIETDEAMKKANAYLKNDNYTSLNSHPLRGTKKSIISYLSDVNDGVALFNDRSFLDDDDSEIIGSLRVLLSDLLGEMTSNRHIIAAVTSNIAHTAKISFNDNILIIPFKGADDSQEPEITQYYTEKLIENIISFVSLNDQEIMSATKLFFDKWLSQLNLELNSKAHSIFNIVILTNFFLEFFFKFKILTEEDIQFSINLLIEKNEGKSPEMAIQYELARILSIMINDGELKIIEGKERNTFFEPETNCAIVKDSTLLIEDFTIKSKIIPNMKHVKCLQGLVKSLAITTALHSTSHGHYPMNLFTSKGESVRIYFYGLSQNILDYQAQEKIANIHNEEFFIQESEKPTDFLPIMSNQFGEVIGRSVDIKNDENNSCFITGQSGFGKSFLMAQLVASCSKLNHRVVLFDSSDSFSEYELSKHLSTEFVQENVSFHNLCDDKIPVNLFKVDRNASLPTQKKALMGIITAGVGNLTTPQTNVLRTIISSALQEAPADHISTVDILDCLDQDNSTHESLRNRLEPLFEDIECCGIINQNWNDLFALSKPIIVIQTDAISTENGCQLFDMLIQSLFWYKQEFPNENLDIFIDEIQNQNFGAGSSISKILREGRKFHISFFGATQDYQCSDIDMKKAISKADTRLFLKPTPTSEKAVAEAIGNRTISNRFDTMERGDCIIKGNCYSKTHKRNVPAVIIGKVFNHFKKDTN